MARLAQTEGLTDVQREILSTVRAFVEKEVLPYATELEHKDEFPAANVEGMRELAEMATKVEASHALMVRVARVKDAGARNDLEAGMAKYLAAEFCRRWSRTPSGSTGATATQSGMRSSGSTAGRGCC